MEKIQQIKEKLKRIKNKTSVPIINDNTRKDILRLTKQAISIIAEMEKEERECVLNPQNGQK